MKNFIRKITPEFVLTIFRKYKKNNVRKQIEYQKNKGISHTKESLIIDLKKCGIKTGDDVLVHSSLSKIGYIENGPKTFVDALLEIIGTNGNLLMPTSPNDSYQIDYIQNKKIFDVKNDSSKLGAITEYFRSLTNSIRSEHPTEPVSCFGPKAEFYTNSHFGNLTPYNVNSPFYKICEQKGKILYVGVTLDNAGTNLHVLEDIVENFKFPVYCDEIFNIKIRRNNGNIENMYTKVHNPVFSKQRKCDELLPMFLKEKVYFETKIGNAKTLVFDADKMLKVMLKEYKENGVTMYTPKGS